MSGLGQKLKVILWKSYILRKRHWLLSLFEVVTPLLLYFFFTKYSPTEMKTLNEYTIYNVQHLDDLVKKLMNSDFYSSSVKQIAYTPQTQFTKEIMTNLEKKLNETSLKNYFEVKNFPSEKQLNKWLNSQDDRGILYNMIGIIFNHDNPQLRYTIRVFKDLTAPLDNLFGMYSADTYFRSMFMIIQMMIDVNFIKLKDMEGAIPNIGLQRFPDEGFESISFANTLFPLITTFSFVFIIPAILKKIVEEKQSGIKELQKMMGLRAWTLWGGWMVHSLMVYSISVLVITILFKYHWAERISLLYQVDSWFVIWYLFMLFTVTVILYCFAISSFFTSPNLAMISGILLWIIPPFMCLNMLVSTSPASRTVQLASCLFPQVCLSWAFTIFVNFQQKDKVWSWSMFFEKGTTGGMSMAHVIFMFYLDWFLFAFIIWFMDSVKPGPYGRAKPLYFLFQFWNRDTEIFGSVEEGDQNNFEPPPRDIKTGISIQNLRKVFGQKVAVDKVNLDIYEGEITALLGHNGAGKTTTMSILTGLYSPSRGAVIVDGKNIFNDMDQFRYNLGLCPQHNLLFSYLTVIEHLIFFGMLKGLTSECAKALGFRLLNIFRMVNMSNNFVKKLSGGMKRKLCLSIALMGDPKVLMLDEPTSGMDPESRREVWDILLSYRGERTILITTHFMEEADVLGDRIAIMDHGRVSCYGTSIFLKKLYGTGYHIVILKDSEKSETPISTIIESHLNEPKLKSNLPTQLSYNVSSCDSPKFSALFSVLEAQKSELGINGISIACTTMEDVFLKVAEGGLPTDYKLIPADVLLNPLPAVATKIRVEGWPLRLQQLKALFVKKMLFLYRTWLSTIIFTLTPLLAVCLVLGGGSFSNDTQEDLSAEMRLSMYGQTEVPYTFNQMKDMADVFTNMISEEDGTPDQFTSNINEGLISRREEDKSYYHKVVVGAEFNRTTVTGLYNGLAVHAAPISLNLITNTILKSYNPSFSIVVTNHPFLGASQTEDHCDTIYREISLVKALPWILLACGIMIIEARFISLPLTERSNNAKQLQLMTGLSPSVYWLSHFLWDFLLYFAAVLLVICAVWLLDADKSYILSRKMDLFFFLLLFYGISGIPFAYIFSYITKSSAKAMSLFLMFNLLTGIVAPMITLGIEIFYAALKESPGVKFELIKGLLCLNPLYTETSALIRLLTLMNMESTCHKCSETCNYSGLFEKHPQYFWNNLQYVIFLMTEWMLYWLLILLIEYGVLRKWWAKFQTLWIGPMFKYTIVEDDDVLEEKQRAKAFLANNNYNQTQMPVLKVCGLGKKYSRNDVAVHEVSFLVEKGQCFGLLGVNGAGKTTTFKMLTGEETPTLGTASIFCYDLVNERSKYLREIGYCPQFDGIIEVLTGEEMLRMYAALRGTPLYKVDTEVENWIRFMGIEEFAKAQCGKYSGGNKRKLSAAIALIGDPPVAFLDEPTAGVDPVARRKLWDVLAQSQKTGQAIVLTSHSMEECEALCSRLTILVGGHMKCIGTTQYLKQKFGQGYTIMIKLCSSCPNAEIDLHMLKNAVNRTFSNCFIKDEHKGLLHYHIAENSMQLSVLFSKLEQLRQTHPVIEDYTVGNTTLEQVFMSFAKQVPPTIVIEPVDV